MYRRISNYINHLNEKFTADHTSTWAASLAFYTILSLAPLLVLFVVFSAQISPELQVSFIREARNIVGRDAAAIFDVLIKNAQAQSDLQRLSGILGLATVAVSASLIFGELRSALNHIFRITPKVPAKEGFVAGFLHWLQKRALQVGMALSFILTLIASLVASSFITAMVATEDVVVIRGMNILITYFVFTFLYTLMFRYLPDEKIRWGLAARGGLITSAFFIVGKELIGIYLGNSALGSAYGAAGSVVVLTVWVFYSTMITFLGAQVLSITFIKQRSKWSENPSSTGSQSAA